MIAEFDSVFELSDVPGIAAKMPILVDRPVLGIGMYSIVFDGLSDNTVLKLTNCSASVDFIQQFGHRVGIPNFVRHHGHLHLADVGDLQRLEIQRLTPLTWRDHELLVLERDAVRAAVSHCIAQSEADPKTTLGDFGYTESLSRIINSRMFSESVCSALGAVREFIQTTEHSAALDLGNPDNYMTDGTNLIITDPVTIVH